MFIDIIFPRTQTKDVLPLAQRLHIHGVCGIGTDTPPLASNAQDSQSREQPPLSQDVSVFYGSLSTSRRKQSDVVIHRSQGDDRSIIEQGSIDLIYDLEISSRADFLHHRNSGLNQVLCNLLQKKKIAYAIAFSTLLHTSSRRRSILIGRVMQNIFLCRKYSVPMIIASFAQTPFELRAFEELQSLGISLGMQPTEAKAALSFLGERIQQRKKQRDAEKHLYTLNLSDLSR
ncbi:hypothetical protein HYW21_07370 [Candidatus Woesearchaeota archaeon]|nr:hypothetical protein [Candidatus Woesearchaeota archaeon]